MRVLFAFDDGAWQNAAARRTVETLASLLETPHRMAAAPGAHAGPDEALVFVGAPAAAPPDAAAVIAVEGWPEWEPRSLEPITVAGEPLPCPPGTPSSGEGARFPAVWLRAAAFALAREEELRDPRRDQWGCYSGAYTRLAEIGLLERPFVNHMARSLERCLESHAVSRGHSLERVPRWPAGARFAVALTHDVDDVTLRSFHRAWRLLRQARSPRSYALRAGLKDLARAVSRPAGAPDPYWAFERWMGEEERHGFRSTFYVCAPSPSRRHEYDVLYDLGDRLEYEGRRITVGELLREMRRRGHEVGLHGSYWSHASAEELALQRAQIAEAVGVGVAGVAQVAQVSQISQIAGIRQHFLRFDIGATWREQAAAGFEYDTTLGYNEALGFRAGIAAPYRPWEPRGGVGFGLWQLPLTVMDGTLFRTLKLDAASAASAVSRHLDSVEAVGGLAVLLWHPNAADEGSFPGWWSCYLRVLDELSRRGAWVASAGEIARWWQERSTRMSASDR